MSETSRVLRISSPYHSDAAPPRGTLLVSGSLRTVTQTEQTPAPKPRHVLINYQQRLYPAATGGKRCMKGTEENVTCDSSTDAAVPPPGLVSEVRATKVHPLEMR